MDHLFGVKCSAFPSSTKVLAVNGMEAISTPYRFDLLLRMEGDASAAFEPARAIGERVKLDFLDHGQPRESVHGVLALVELAEVLPHEVVYRAQVVPEVWWISLNRHSRVFVETSLPDIMRKILIAGGFSENKNFRFVLENEARDYPKVDHVCQYRESDFDFISRWMERVGMYYYFEQTGDQEVLVFCDTKSVLEKQPAESKTFSPQLMGSARTEESFGYFTQRCVASPTQVRVRDYDYLRPDMEIVSETKPSPGQVLFTSSVTSHRTTSSTQRDADRMAKVRSQELMAHASVYHGEGCVYGLQPGYKFSLQIDPRFALAHLTRFEHAYLTTEVMRHGHEALESGDLVEVLSRAGHPDGDQASYHVQITAIHAEVQYRPARRTSIPRIDGLEDGVVDGPVEDIYAQIDDHGRYLVKIRFDEHDNVNGKASMRVRMMQPHGGSQEGFHFPLRRGTEVLLAFLGGDPDRPVIAGVAPNSHRPSVVTKANATQNVIQSGGLNRLVMEDLDGKQHVHLSSPTQKSHLHIGDLGPNGYNMELTTDGTGLIHTGDKLDITVGGTKLEEVTKATTNKYHDTLTEEIQGPVTQTIEKAVKQTIKAHVDQTITTGGMKQEITGKLEETVTGEKSETIKGHFLEKVTTGGKEQKVTGLHDVTITGDRKETITGGLTQTVVGDVKVIAKTATYVIAGDDVKIAPKKIVDISAYKLALVGFDVAVIGVVAKAYGSKNEYHGFKTDFTSVRAQNTPLSFGQFATKVEQAMTAYGQMMIDLGMTGMWMRM